MAIIRFRTASGKIVTFGKTAKRKSTKAKKTLGNPVRVSKKTNTKYRYTRHKDGSTTVTLPSTGRTITFVRKVRTRTAKRKQKALGEELALAYGFKPKKKKKAVAKKRKVRTVRR